MNRGYLLCLVIILALSYTAAAENFYTFASHSLLQSSKWIKVETADEGIYEISYAALKEMGFDNPASVCVYGEGGTPRPTSLMSGDSRLVEDNPPQVPVIHKNNKIYFYGRGIRNLVFNGERFVYLSRNIYNCKGHYYLSDSGTPVNMSNVVVSAELQNSAPLRSDGMGYLIYDDDRRMGTDRAGQQFWNLRFDECPGKSFDTKIRLPGKKSEGDYVLETSIPYIHTSNNRHNASFRITFNGTSKSLQPDKESSHIINYIMSGSLDSSLQTHIGISAINEEASGSYLDYWLLSYSKEPGNVEDNQDIIAYPGVEDTATGVTSINIPPGYLAIDISDPALPQMLTTTADKAFIWDSGHPHTIMIFNPSEHQFDVKNPVSVSCTDLHSCSESRIELLIITVPRFREYADKIAALHKTYDNINVLVTEPQTIYDEFGAGNVDPLAVRMLGKMLHSCGSASLKNILFIGPLRSDVRNVLGYTQPDNFLIGFQEDIGLETDRTPSLTFDYFGMTGDNVDAARLYLNGMDVGVGWLPVDDEKSAKRVVAKIKDYLRKLDGPDMSETVNEFMAFSHGGDNHAHDEEIKTWNRKMDYYFSMGKLGRFPVSTLYQDLFGNDYSRAISDRFNDGKLVSVYFGHARPEAFGQMKSLYSMGDFNSLRNPVPSFLFMAGCEALRPDFGETGIGSLPVTDSPRALVGAVASSRSTLSGNNSDLANYFFESLIIDETQLSCNPIPITAGEAFARMKCRSSHFNKLSYIYIGDPALTIPVPLRKAECSITNTRQSGFMPGEIVVIEGNLLNRNGINDPTANGKAVAKLMAPPISLPLPGSSPVYKGSIGDLRLTAVSGNVKDGRFKIRIPLPEETARYLSVAGTALSTIPLFISVYDPDTRLAYSGYIPIPMGYPGTSITPSPADEPDNSAPVANMIFDEIDRSLTIDVSDDVGFIPHSGIRGGISLYIDDIEVSATQDMERDIAVREKTFTIYPGSLLPGSHKALLSVSDTSGNRSVEKTINFTIPPTPVNISIIANAEYTTDSIQFTINGPAIPQPEFYILDSGGREIYSESLSGNHITWSRYDTYSGDPAPSGLARIGIRSKGGAVVFSEYKEFLILD